VPDDNDDEESRAERAREALRKQAEALRAAGERVPGLGQGLKEAALRRAMGLDPAERLADQLEQFRREQIVGARESDGTQRERSSEKATVVEQDPSDPTLDRMRRNFERPPEGLRKAFSMSRDDALFWIGVALFGDGVYLMAEHPYYAIPLIGAGVALLAWSNRGHMPRPPVRLAALVLAMVVTISLAGFDYYDRHFGNPQETPTPQTQSFGFAESTKPPLKHPSKVYSDAEKRKLLDLMGQLSTLLNEQGLRSARVARSLGGMPWTSSEGLENTAQQAHSVIATLNLLNNKIWNDIVPNNPGFAVDLNYVLDGKAKFDQFQHATEVFLGQITNFQRNLPAFSQDQRNWIAGLIQQGGGELWWRTGQDFEAWINQSNSRIDTEREGLK
jgi:hypothetical protein